MASTKKLLLIEGFKGIPKPTLCMPFRGLNGFKGNLTSGRTSFGKVEKPKDSLVNNHRASREAEQ